MINVILLILAGAALGVVIHAVALHFVRGRTVTFTAIPGGDGERFCWWYADFEDFSEVRTLSPEEVMDLLHCERHLNKRYRFTICATETTKVEREVMR